MLGFLNVHKPQGLTSHDCIARLRKVLGTRRIGHSGTLDPLATGVLPVGVNEATRLLPFLVGGKSYRAVIRLGQSTTTDDREGEILQDSPCPHLTSAEVEALLPQFIGTIEQVPPAFSAIKVSGQRLYQLARSGDKVVLPKRTVVIESIQIWSWERGSYPSLTLDIICGTGTYIRSIARDLGQALGCGGMLVALERTFSNGFKLTDSVLLEDVNSSCVVQPDRFLAHLEAIELSPEEGRRWQQGQKIMSTKLADQTLRVYQGGQFLGIGNNTAGLLLPKVVLPIPIAPSA